MPVLNEITLTVVCILPLNGQVYLASYTCMCIPSRVSHLYTTFRCPEMVHRHTRTSNADSRPKTATTVLQPLSAWSVRKTLGANRMFALPSQPIAGMFASKKVGLELTSQAKGRKNARNFTNRSAHGCNVHTLPPTCRVKSLNATLPACPSPFTFESMQAAAPPPN